MNTDRITVNDYGTVVTLAMCPCCGSEFTVCPAVDLDKWGHGCLAPNCESYDPGRDADRYFKEG
jgi:hypothetical protein